MEYKGFETVQFVDDAEMVKFYQNVDENYFNLKINEYAFVKNPDGDIVDKIKWTGAKNAPVGFKSIRNEYTGKLSPINPEQEFAFDMLQDANTTVKLLTGRWGSGKTKLMVAHAIQYVMKGKVDKLIWVRNNYETKDTKAIGFLPGEQEQKLIVWAAPLADHLGGEYGLRRAIDNRQVEIQHLGFIRGRDITNAIVLCSEAENLTSAHIALLLSRIGNNAQLWLDGDIAQTDHKKFETDSGICACINKLSGNPLFGYVELQKTERSETAELATLLT